MRFLRILPFAAMLSVLVLGALSVPMPSDVPAAAPRKASAPLSVTVASTTPENDIEQDTLRANAILRDLSATYRYLDDVEIVFGTTPKGEEAVAYYTDGEILISSDHTVELEKILAHEIWHVIDWRDNGQLDWGENLPPENSGDYR